MCAGIEGISSAKSIIPLNLRTRAASATALGAAAANAKLLADQEEREMGHLMATMIEAQVSFFIPLIIEMIQNFRIYKTHRLS